MPDHDSRSKGDELGQSLGELLMSMTAEQLEAAEAALIPGMNPLEALVTGKMSSMSEAEIAAAKEAADQGANPLAALNMAAKPKDEDAGGQ